MKEFILSSLPDSIRR